MGAPPQISVRIFSALQLADEATMRLIMVGAANIDMRGQWLNSAAISSGSKPPLSGTTCTPRRAM